MSFENTPGFQRMAFLSEDAGRDYCFNFPHSTEADARRYAEAYVIPEGREYFVTGWRKEKAGE